ncbi:hypothetical protein Tco_1090957, partial [Tanacetum coccineum]
QVGVVVMLKLAARMSNELLLIKVNFIRFYRTRLGKQISPNDDEAIRVAMWDFCGI